MLTKTRKWLLILVLAVGAIFLVACKDEIIPTPELPKPTKIEISLDAYIGTKGVLIGGDKMELSINPEPVNAVQTVIWSSADTSIATVSQNGEVTGLKGGKVKIKAVSTEDPAIKDEVEIMVYQKLENVNVLLKAMEDLKTLIPTYIAEDVVLPQVENTLVKAEYYYIDGTKIEENLYKHVYVKDALDTINVKVTYLGESLEFPSTLYVVQDVRNNEFLAVDAAKAYIDEFLKTYKNDRIRDNLNLPTEFKFTKNEKTRSVVISWTSSLTTVLKHDGSFIRPNDDTSIVLEAYFVCGEISGVTRTPLLANGYTQAEKMEYLKTNVFPQQTEIEGANLPLPVRDAKFGTTITWISNNIPVLSNTGKMDPYLKTATEVQLTATVSYPGTVSDAFMFTEDVILKINVKPAANEAQSIVLDFGTKLEANTDFPYYFPYGLKSRVDNILPLPTKVGGEGANKDVAVTWTSSETGLFNDTWELQKQYLRYHEVTLTYSITSGDNVATGEVIINVGIATTANTMYMGGRFATRAASNAQRYDELHTFSKDDPVNGTPQEATLLKYPGWTGFTFYTDVLNENGSVTRYQYFANDPFTTIITEGEGGVSFDSEGKMTGKMKTVAGGDGTTLNYQFALWINRTTRDVKIPITFLNYKGSTVKQDINGTTMIRQLSMSYDGWRIGFAADGSGKVTYGFGQVNLETGLIAAAAKAEDGSYVLPEYVTIPAGGIGWSPLTSQNVLAIGDIFCQPGIQLTYLEFNPKY
jgi:hypothetical protein